VNLGPLEKALVAGNPPYPGFYDALVNEAFLPPVISKTGGALLFIIGGVPILIIFICCIGIILVTFIP
jgi:hypothetical protein